MSLISNFKYATKFLRVLSGVRYFSVQQKFTLSQNTTYSEVIKKSVFVAHAARANSFEEAKLFLNNVRDDNATHNCWAYNSDHEQRSSDDSEMTGTAGRPMLQALLTENLVNVMVVVTRYYGGIKLGTGGLLRAYGGTAQTALRNAIKMEYIPVSVVTIQTVHADSHTVYFLLKPFRLLDVQQFDNSTDMTDGGDHMTSLTVEVPTVEVTALRDRVRQALQGRGLFTVNE